MTSKLGSPRVERKGFFTYAGCKMASMVVAYAKAAHPFYRSMPPFQWERVSKSHQPIRLMK